MKVKLLTLLLFFLCVSSQCKKDEPINYKPGDYQGGMLLWKQLLGDDNLESYSNNPVLNKQKNILMSSLSVVSAREVFKLYDGESGKLLWLWDDYLRDEQHFTGNGHIVIDDIIVLCSRNATYAFNIITGQTVWKHFMNPGYGAGNPFIYEGKGGYVYHAFYGEDGDYKNYIFRTKYDNLNWELVCTFVDSTNSYNSIYSQYLTFGLSPKGDELMFFTTWLSNGLSGTKTKLSCYNLTEKHYEWQQDFTSQYNAWGAPQMKVIDEMLVLYAYYGDEYNLIGVNVKDGKQVWTVPMQDFGVGLLGYQGNVIAFCNRNSPVKCISSKDGSILWEQQFSQAERSKINFTFGDAILFKNYLISTQCDNLLVLNADNGNIVYNKKVATDGGCLQFGIAINEKSRTFYVQDRRYVCCYKLPNEIKY